LREKKVYEREKKGDVPPRVVIRLKERERGVEAPLPKTGRERENENDRKIICLSLGRDGLRA